MRDPLQTFRGLETAIAAVSLLIPILLRLADSGAKGFQSSISEYAYMSKSYLFGLLLGAAGMLFLFNGAVYFRNEGKMGLSRAGKWYNVILGLSLIAVVLFPYKDPGFLYLHYFFAGLFFIGNAVVIAIFHWRKYRGVSVFFGIATFVGITLHFTVHVISLLAAEWISLAVIGIHFILESTGVLSFEAGAGGVETAATRKGVVEGGKKKGPLEASEASDRGPEPVARAEGLGP